MDDLKKCPFCGEEADLWRNFGRYGYFVYVECSICSAKSKSYKFPGELTDDWETTIAARRATDAWNRRAGDERAEGT